MPTVGLGSPASYTATELLVLIEGILPLIESSFLIHRLHRRTFDPYPSL